MMLHPLSEGRKGGEGSFFVFVYGMILHNSNTLLTGHPELMVYGSFDALN